MAIGAYCFSFVGVRRSVFEVAMTYRTRRDPNNDRVNLLEERSNVMSDHFNNFFFIAVGSTFWVITMTRTVAGWTTKSFAW